MIVHRGAAILAYINGFLSVVNKLLCNRQSNEQQSALNAVFTDLSD